MWSNLGSLLRPWPLFQNSHQKWWLWLATNRKLVSDHNQRGKGKKSNRLLFREWVMSPRTLKPEMQLSPVPQPGASVEGLETSDISGSQTLQFCCSFEAQHWSTFFNLRMEHSVNLCMVTFTSNTHPKVTLLTKNWMGCVYRYNHAVMRGLFPTGAPFITVLRDPVTRYESAFFYENCPAFFGIENVPNPYQFFVERQMTDNRTEKMYTLRNGMSFDLGLNPRDFNDTRAIRGFIQETERRFDLVLIMEYFDESLALLRRLLCWTMEEMVYVRHNARLQTFRRFHIDDGLKKRVLEWNGADAMLYRHFSETLWRILDLQDEHFWSEVRTLKAASVSATTMCLSPLPSADPVIQVVSGLSLRENIPQPMVDLCKKLATKEDAYLQYFRDRQRS